MPLLGVTMVVLTGLADRTSGGHTSVLALYAVPVAFVGWKAGRWPGLAVAGVAGLAWLVARSTSLPLPDATLIWNALNRAAIFGFIAVVSALLARWSFLADTDTLTGLLNRRAFVDRLRKAAVRAERLETSVVIVFLDLDDFKTVNDRFGHATGDAVLVKTARAIEAAIRAGDVAARFGGDEFAALLWRSSASDAERVGKRLLEGIREAFSAAKETAGTCASVGMVFFPTFPSDHRAALAQADAAMYEAKRGGKGRMTVRTASEPE